MVNQIILARHGETTGDIEDRYGGWYDDELSSLGIKQAQALATKLAEYNIDVLCTSSLIRARQTAQILSEELSKSTIVMERFKEKNQFGILSGMTKQDARSKYPELVAACKTRRDWIEGAERYEDFRIRIDRAWHKLKTFDGTVCAVIHGGVLRTILTDVLGHPEVASAQDCGFIVLDSKGKVVKSEGISFIQNQ